LLTLPAIALALVLAPTAANAATGPYVALGDSYTSAPIVPLPTGDPILCGRSTNNYPQIVRRAIAPSIFTDISCGGATTNDMLNPQALRPTRRTRPSSAP
jgi:hypothetical protein